MREIIWVKKLPITGVIDIFSVCTSYRHKNQDCAQVTGSLIDVIEPKMALINVYHTFNVIKYVLIDVSMHISKVFHLFYYESFKKGTEYFRS